MFGSSARASVVRTAILYTPLFVACALAVVLLLTGVWNFGPVLAVLALVLALLFGYQSIQSLRDLRAQPITTRGPVTRIWSKMDLLVTRSHYIRVGGNIFHVPLQSYWDLREEAKRLKSAGLDDEYLIEVAVEHYPHTGTVESVEILGRVPIVDQRLGETR